MTFWTGAGGAAGMAGFRAWDVAAEGVAAGAAWIGSAWVTTTFGVGRAWGCSGSGVKVGATVSIGAPSSER